MVVTSFLTLSLLFWVMVFLVSLFTLIKSADYFTNSAETIGFYFGLPSFIVGVTIVSIGSSLPELIIAIIAVTRGAPRIPAGNVVGSNINNIFLILALASLCCRTKLRATYELIHVDVPLLVGSAFLLAVIFWDGIVTLPEALLCIAGLFLYLLYTIHVEKIRAGLEKDEDDAKTQLRWRTIAILIGSAVFIYLGATYTVEAVINLADLLNIGREIIAVSVVALGTTLPEMMISVNAARKGKSEIAIGNALGSNIFNVFGVIGISALFGRIIVPESILTFALPMMLIATVLYVFITLDKEITRWEGGMLLIFYIFFIGTLFNLF